MGDRMLHVYGQYIWHDDVQIVGNGAGLRALRDAIDKALADGEVEGINFFVGDGEGYNITVAKKGNDWSEWGKYLLPYAAEYAMGGEVDPRYLPHKPT